MEFLEPDLVNYCLKHSDPEPPLLQKLNRETHLKVLKPRMLSGHLQGRFLAMISKLLRPVRILEIGTYTGYSAICLAEGLSEKGKLHTIDNNEELKAMAEAYFKEAGLGDKIKMHIGAAQEVIPSLQEKWDLVFIDADKENYSLYFDQVIDQMQPGGLIIADNVLWSGKVLGEAKNNDRSTRALQAFNQKIQDDPRVENMLLPLRDGLMICRTL